MITDEEAESAAYRLRDNAKAAGHAKGVRVYVEGFLKVLKARIQRETNLESFNAREEYAYADPRLESHLQAISQAVENEAKFMFEREGDKAIYEVWRTQSSNIRAGVV